MEPIPIESQPTTGLLPGMRVKPMVVSDVLVTREAASRLLITPGVTVEIVRPGRHAVRVVSEQSLPRVRSYRVTVTTHVPAGVIAVYVGEQLALRLDCELPLTDEIRDVYAELAWTPCPECGARLLPSVPGHVTHRWVCAVAPHHHWLPV
mgnify:CR=1 FL=1